MTRGAQDRDPRGHNLGEPNLAPSNLFINLRRMTVKISANSVGLQTQN